MTPEIVSMVDTHYQHYPLYMYAYKHPEKFTNDDIMYMLDYFSTRYSAWLADAVRVIGDNNMLTEENFDILLSSKHDLLRQHALLCASATVHHALIGLMDQSPTIRELAAALLERKGYVVD